MKSLRPFAAFLSLALVLFVADMAAQRGRGGQQAGGPGSVTRVEWSDDGQSVAFTTEGERYRLDLATGEKVNLGLDPQALRGRGGGRGARGRGRGRGGRGGRGGQAAGDPTVASTGTRVGPAPRGRQYLQVDSPDGLWEAHYRDWNVVLVEKATGREVQVTTEGNETIHYGTASWVYGEELNQKDAMWWTPDSKKLIFYRFDDTGVQPFHLVTGWSDINTEHYPEYYPKAGAQNPQCSLLVYDLMSGQTIPIQAGVEREHYLFNLQVSPDGSTMMVSRTDRLQQDLEVLAMDLETGECRVIVSEHQDTWQTNRPQMRYLEDRRRFIWPSDKTGFTHYEVRDLYGNLHHAVTGGEFQTGGIQFVDEDANLVGFTGYSSDANPYYLQYHMVGLDGENQRRITSTDLHHSNFNLSPDKKWLIAQYEATNTPPNTVVYNTANGSIAARLAETDPNSAANLAEMFKFVSNDGRFDIYGVLFFPADFDPSKSYPVINTLYAGPGSNEINASYVSTPRAETNRGYLVIRVNSRGSGNRGKEFLGSNYRRLGDVEIQDHADAIRLLRQRAYFDGDRVGITGSSYGGYMAAMGIFKHPDVYAASVNRSGVTDWRNYDTIYTERYMSTPQLNPEGYKNGSVMTYVDQFEGQILILHGMVDDNVHPNNAFQLIDAMDKADKRYESRFFPNAGHGVGAGGNQSMWEFFDRVLKPEVDGR